MSPAVVALLSVLILAVAGALTAVWMRTRREVTTPTERAVHAALHTASLAARPRETRRKKSTRETSSKPTASASRSSSSVSCLFSAVLR